MELVFLTLLIVLMILALSSGFPVAFALPGSAILSIAAAAFCGFLFEGDVSAYFAQDGPTQWLSAGVTNFRSLYWIVERDTLIAIPLFVFMGIMLQRSKIAEDLLVAMAQLFGPVPGGLGISVVFVGALLAATTGIVGATVIAMGLISLPAMLRNNYDKSLACGTICASGTLGQIIPPSIVLIILADQLSSAADQASTMRTAEYKQATGEFTMPSEFDITSASAGDMFMGALVPGLILVGLYMLYILISAILKPNTAPPVPYEGYYDRQFFIKILLALVPPLALIFAVLGSIIFGIATVNQAGAIGAVGAMIMGGYRLTQGRRHTYTPAIISVISIISILVLLNFFDLNIKNVDSKHDWIGICLALVAVLALLFAVTWSAWRAYKTDDTLHGVMIDTCKTTSMVFIILIGAAMLTSAFRGFGGEELVREFLTGLPGGFWTQFIVVMAVIFLLGFFLDFIEIAVVVVPIVAPILLADPQANITAVWLGVMIGLNIQTSFLTPPFGFSLFYLRGVAPPSIKTTHIYKGAVAFIVLQLAGLAIAGTFPGLVNYMPNRTYLTSDTAPPPINPKLQLCMEEMLFEDYKQQKPFILDHTDKMLSLDISNLPSVHQDTLHSALTGIKQTFDLVTSVQFETEQLDAYAVNYRPLHYQVRAIQKEIKNHVSQVGTLEQTYRRLARNHATDSDLYKIESDISIEKYQIRKLEDSIPDEWESSRSQFVTLNSAVTDAKLKYRQNSDLSYRKLLEVKTLLDETEQLSSLNAELTTLSNLETVDANEFIEKIKVVERKLNALSGIETIKDALTQARRALKQDVPNWDTFSLSLSSAIESQADELRWREQAKHLLPEINTYESSIRQSIGLRQQSKLSPSQAKQIAMCQSSHRDISLNF